MAFFCSKKSLFIIKYTMFEYLPKIALKEINKIKSDDICELRIRANGHSVINCVGQVFSFKYVFTNSDVEEIVLNVCKRSIYSYEEQIKQGFITTCYGERIGLAGEFVYDGNKIQTLKNFSSLCIRIPKQVDGFSLKFFNEYYDDKSVLIVSKTGVGKTTFLRDLVKNISNNTLKNIVVIDERNEIACKNDVFSFDVGKTCDVLTYSSKDYGFITALRTLNPEIVATDELVNKNDFKGVINGYLAGLKIIATIHAENEQELLKKKYMKEIFEKKIFDKFVFLSKEKNKRKVEIYSSNFEKLCCYLN